MAILSGCAKCTYLFSTFIKSKTPIIITSTMILTWNSLYPRYVGRGRHENRSSPPCRHRPHEKFTYAVPSSPQPQEPPSTTDLVDLQKLQQDFDRTRPASQFNREVVAEMEILCKMFESYGVLDFSQYPFRGIAEAVVREHWVEKGIWAFEGPYPDSDSEWAHSRVDLGSVNSYSGVRRHHVLNSC